MASKTADNLLHWAQWREDKDTAHGTLLRGQRPPEQRGGAEEAFDKNPAERKQRGQEVSKTPTGGGKVQEEQRGSERSLAVSGDRRSARSRQRLSLSIIQCAHPWPYIFFNSPKTTQGIVTSASSVVFCRSSDSHERPDFGVNPSPPPCTHHPAICHLGEGRPADC